MLYSNTIYCRVKTHDTFFRHFVKWSQQQISLDASGYIRVNADSSDSQQEGTESLMIPLSSIQNVCDHPYAVSHVEGACLSIISKLEDDQKIELELQFLLSEEAHEFASNLESMMTQNLQKLKVRAVPLINDLSQQISISISRNMTELDENESKDDESEIQRAFEKGILTHQYVDKAVYTSIDALLEKNHQDDAIGIYGMMDLPCLKIFMVCVGTRGDVQPFVHIAIQLLQDGHCVRFATHGVFKDYVLDIIPSHLLPRLEFNAIAGDPVALSAFCVKSKGQLLRPSIAVLRMIPSYSLMMKDIIQSVWAVVNDSTSTPHCIISNPVTFVSHHIAQRLSIPVHIMFPQAVVPTKGFPHPYSSGVFSFDSTKKWNFENNYLSYTVVDRLVWHGMSSMINDLRVDRMDMAPVSNDFNPIIDMAIPFTLLSSNNLIPRPKDWPMHCSIAGSLRPLHQVSKDQQDQEGKDQNDSKKGSTSKAGGTSSEQEQYALDIKNAISQESLESFLQSRGAKPIVYIGFGSMVIEDFEFEKIIGLLLEAAAIKNTRVIVQSQSCAKIAPKTFEKLARHAERLSQNISDIELSYGASDDDTTSGYLSESSSTAIPFALSAAVAFEQSGSTKMDAYHHYIHTGTTLYVSEIIDFVSQAIVKDVPCEVAMLSLSAPRFATQEYNNRCRSESRGSSFSNYSGAEYEYCTEPLAEWSAPADAFLITEDFTRLEHSWLFPNVTAVISHGGQGTTITALRAGASVWIIYFFGDQIMIGNFAYQSGVGPMPTSVASLSLVLCVDSIGTLIDPLVRIRVKEFQSRLETEDGALAAKQLFYRNLPMPSYLCEVSIFMGKMVLAEAYCLECGGGLRMSMEVAKCLHRDKHHHTLEACTYFDWNQHLVKKGIITSTSGATTTSSAVDSTSSKEVSVIITNLLKPFKNIVVNGSVGMGQSLSKLYRSISHKAKGFIFTRDKMAKAATVNHEGENYRSTVCVDSTHEDGVLVSYTVDSEDILDAPTHTAESPTAFSSSSSSSSSSACFSSSTSAANVHQVQVALRMAKGLMKLMEDISPIHFKQSDVKKSASIPIKDLATYLLSRQMESSRLNHVTVDELCKVLHSLLSLRKHRDDAEDLEVYFPDLALLSLLN